MTNLIKTEAEWIELLVIAIVQLYESLSKDAVKEDPKYLQLVPPQFRTKELCQLAFTAVQNKTVVRRKGDDAEILEHPDVEEVWSFIPDAIKPLIQR